jgi:arylsulfatase A-like enzyme
MSLGVLVFADVLMHIDRNFSWPRHTRSLPILLGLLLTVTWAHSGDVMAADAPTGPNIILVITDDQGYGDLACHGNPVLSTPNLDRFHAQAVRFRQFMVSPTCAPTRCALMTGRHEFRSGVTHTIQERERMALSAKTLPESLRRAGYTTGIFGKWHLGDEDRYQPEKRGFDEVFIHGAGGIGQTYPGSCGDAPNNSYFNPAILHNGRFVKTKGYCTDLFFEQAMNWISRQAKKKPFFCYLSTNTPHAPLICPPEYENKYTGKVPANTAKFYGMIENIDDNFGRLLKKVAELGIEKDTLIVFMTDNGGTAGCEVFNAGMRGRKGTPYLGGIRVPCFFRWPGTLKPGDVDALAGHIDLFPTLAEIAAAPLPAGVQLDGRSLVPLLKNPQSDWPERILFTHLGRWPTGKAGESKYRHCSLRNRRFQMVSNQPSGEKSWELYDLLADPGQTRNVIDKFPEVVREFEAAYDAWWESVQPGLVNENAVGPAVNPFKERYWRQFPEERPKEMK